MSKVDELKEVLNRWVINDKLYWGINRKTLKIEKCSSLNNCDECLLRSGDCIAILSDCVIPTMIDLIEMVEECVRDEE